MAANLFGIAFELWESDLVWRRCLYVAAIGTTILAYTSTPGNPPRPPPFNATVQSPPNAAVSAVAAPTLPAQKAASSPIKIKPSGNSLSSESAGASGDSTKTAQTPKSLIQYIAPSWLRGASSPEKEGIRDRPEAKVTTAPDSQSLYLQGRKFARGDGVARDFSKARTYFEAAARNNHPQAIYSLGLMYLRGDGVASDKTRAREYLKKAAALGSDQAADVLSNMNR